MEKNSAADSSSSSVSSAASSASYLKHLSLNKFSHKISKPPSSFAPNNDTAAVSGTSSLLDHPPNLQQPPVYNINKSDFREVVQKLTGASPAADRLSSPPPIHPPKPPSSRLQRIRPPPLPQLAVRPPPLLNNPPNHDPIPNPQLPISRPTMAPLSPLPPLPTVHAAAESPVSAYMRFLQSSSGDSRSVMFSGFSPMPPPPPPTSDTGNRVVPPPSFQLPLSPLPFGCLNSPRSSSALLSPGLLLSPTSGFPYQIPLSPTVPVPSPRYKGGI